LRLKLFLKFIFYLFIFILFFLKLIYVLPLGFVNKVEYYHTQYSSVKQTLYDIALAQF